MEWYRPGAVVLQCGADSLAGDRLKNVVEVKTSIVGMTSMIRGFDQSLREMIGAIARLQLGRIAKRVQENHRVPFTYDDAVVRLIASRCTELESGGRMIDAILTNTMLPRISEEFLRRMLEGKSIDKVHVSVEANDFQYGFE